MSDQQAAAEPNDAAGGATAAATTTAAAPRSFFDSRTAAPSSSAASETLPGLLVGDDGDLDASTSTARYLTHTNGSSGAQTFSKAFAVIRQTETYANLPAPAPAPPSATAAGDAARAAKPKDAATVVYVNRCQTGNPLLRAVRNVSLEFRDGMMPDYVMGEAASCCCVLFLSVRYHLLHNGYLEERLRRVTKEDATPYRTRVVLCFVDVDDNEVALREINRVTLLSHFTLILAWSWLEAARYLETLKAYENKSATLIKEKVEAEFLPKANDVLTSIRSVNKTDVVTLLSTFGSVQGVMNASMEELSLCPGVGAKKVRQLLETFHEPFMKK